MRMKSIAAWFIAMTLMGLSAQAAVCSFTNAVSGNRNFSHAANWDVVPSGSFADRLRVATVAGTKLTDPAIVDSGFTIGFNQVNIFSGVGEGISYVSIASGATLKSYSEFQVGSLVNGFFGGHLTIQSGGSVDNNSSWLNVGNLTIGGAAKGGTLIVEAGAALFRNTSLDVKSTGILQMNFGATGVTAFKSTKTNVGATNRVDGLLRVDLEGLTQAEGTYTLIDGNDSDLLFGGALLTDLIAAGGSITNSAQSSRFEVLNAGTRPWELKTANGGQDLVLTVIPEPITVGMLGVGGFLCLVYRRYRA